MFGIFNHPKPVVSNRPVAEHAIKMQQRATIEPGHLLAEQPAAHGVGASGAEAPDRFNPAEPAADAPGDSQPPSPPT